MDNKSWENDFGSLMTEQNQTPAGREKKAVPPAGTRQATQADIGWRTRAAAQQPAVRQATQADTGWRTRAAAQQPAVRQATQADTGWRTRAAAQQPAARQATQADEGWRVQAAAQQPAARQATQADTGWRTRAAAQQPAVRQATQADTGWRTRAAAQQPVARQATQADTGWRTRAAAQQPAVRQATQADEGWRAQAAAQQPGTQQATQADEGWRAQAAAQQPGTQPATQADKGWRMQSSGAAVNAAPVNVAGDPRADAMAAATAGGFATISDFKRAAQDLKMLTSYDGSRYSVVKTLSTEGGESAVLLCSASNGSNVVAKIYFNPVNSAGSSIAARLQVLNYMQTPEGRKYTLPVMTLGNVQIGMGTYYFEIMPFCPKGDLSAVPPFDYERLRILADYLNEALHSMHTAGILHRDIKPANLYIWENKIVFGDFGVAKLAGGGATRTTAGTDGYRAPESVLAVSATESAFFFDEKCDYYSLGVTLGCLFEGHFVFENMSAPMVTAAVRNSKLPLTRSDPHRDLLENLLKGLCQYDSNYRFGYEDVKRWLVDPNYTGGGLGEEWPKAFRMLGDAYTDERSMFEGMTRDAAHWKEALGMLYGKYVEDFFRSFRTDLARAAQQADENWRGQDQDKGLAVFLKTLFPAGPIVWRGYTFQSLQELGTKMAGSRNPAGYSEMLKKQLISHWLRNTRGISAPEETIALVESIEQLAVSQPEAACYWFGNAFSAEPGVTVCGKNARSLDELFTALFSSHRDFYVSDGYDMLADRAVGGRLYGFLYYLGYKDICDRYWSRFSGCDAFDKACLLLEMLDTIGESAGVSRSRLQNFFLHYGPMGIGTFTLGLVQNGGVYEPLDSDGRWLLSQLASVQIPGPAPVRDMYRELTPLMDLVGKLQLALVDNPLTIPTGCFEEHGVLCTNLVGCFAMELLGRAAPLGFHAWINSAEGDNRR